MADKRIIKDGNLSGTAGKKRGRFADIVDGSTKRRRLKRAKQIEELRERVYELTDDPSLSSAEALQATIKEAHQDMNEKKVFRPDTKTARPKGKKTPKKKPVKKAKGGMVTKWQTKWG